FAPARNFVGMAFGIRSRKLATDIAGAGDKAGADRGGFGREPERLDRRLGRTDMLVPDARDQQVLPYGKTDIAVAKIARDRGEGAHLVSGELSHGQDNPDPVQTWLLLRMTSDVGGAVERRTRKQR